MKAGDRDTLVFMQNAEPLSLYCGDETDGETLRACEQIKESLYALQGRRHRDRARHSPRPATPNADLDGLDLHAPRRRDLPRRLRRSTPTTSSLSYAVQWDAEQPAPHRPLGRLRRTCPACGAASSTRRPARCRSRSARSRRDDGGAAPRRPRSTISDLATSTREGTAPRDSLPRPAAPGHASRSCSGSCSSCSRWRGSSPATRAAPCSASGRPTRCATTSSIATGWTSRSPCSSGATSSRSPSGDLGRSRSSTRGR